MNSVVSKMSLYEYSNAAKMTGVRVSSITRLALSSVVKLLSSWSVSLVFQDLSIYLG